MIKIRLSQDALHAVLGPIVAPGAPVVDGLRDQVVDVAQGFLELHAATVREEAVFQVANQSLATLETGQVVLAHQHHLDEDDDLLGVGLQGAETTSHPRAEVPERIGFHATHHVQHLLGQLEWRCFKFDPLAWRIAQKEAKVNVEHMTLDINENVFIVPVLDLQNVADEAVGAEGVREVFNCCLVLLGPGLAELTVEVIDDGWVWSTSLLLDR